MKVLIQLSLHVYRLFGLLLTSLAAVCHHAAKKCHLNISMFVTIAMSMYYTVWVYVAFRNLSPSLILVSQT